jgi:hypothetical protein
MNLLNGKTDVFGMFTVQCCTRLGTNEFTQHASVVRAYTPTSKKAMVPEELYKRIAIYSTTISHHHGIGCGCDDMNQASTNPSF